MSRYEGTVDPRFGDRSRQPGLDLLRATAIAIVVLYHGGNLGFSLPGEAQRFGWVGVDLFFVLSGYLIGGQLLGALAREGRLDLRRFYLRRALRILPAYFFILAVYFLIPSWREYPQIYPLWKFLLSVQNIALQGGTAFSHAWSLAVEDQFYLGLPWLLLLLVPRRSAGLPAAVAVIVAGVALRAFLVYHLHMVGSEQAWRPYQRWIYYPTWTRLDPLTLGVALAAIETHRPRWWQSLMTSASWLWAPALGSIALALQLGESDFSVALCLWQFPLLAFGMAALLVCAVSPRLPLARWKLPGAGFIASIAYSVYLTHKLTIHWVTGWCDRLDLELDSGAAIVLLQLCIYVVGAALFFAIERPFLLLRRRVARREGSERAPYPISGI